MGILNVTPDSFSDGGAYATVENALTRARAMLEQGADIIDVGGESTRPGAQPVSAREQIERTLPVIEELAKQTDRPLSIDTTQLEVARAALAAGATIINDVSAGRGSDDQLFNLAAEQGTGLVLMHMRGQPTNMQQDPTYDHVVAEVKAFLLQRAAAAETAGVDRSQIVLDPGIGFGKTTRHNLLLLASLGDFVETGYPILLGASRKRFLGELTGLDHPEDRAVPTAATTAVGVEAGVRIFRVHDVHINRLVADVTFSIHEHRNQGPEGHGTN